MSNKILLFIPAYNCAPQIIRVLAQINDDILKYVSQIIVVNNRSTDNTEEVICSFISTHPELPLKLLRNYENYNLGGSHKVAFQYAIDNNFDYVIVLHGDNQGTINDLLPYLKKGTHKKYDCLLGSRFMQNSKLQGYSKFRTFGNFVFNAIYSLLLMKPVYDLGSGLNIYRTKSLKKRFWMKYPDTLMFNAYLLLGSYCFNRKIKFFPIHWREDDQISNVKIFSSAIVLLKLIVKYRLFGKKSLQTEHRLKPFKTYKFEEIK